MSTTRNWMSCTGRSIQRKATPVGRRWISRSGTIRRRKACSISAATLPRTPVRAVAKRAFLRNFAVWRGDTDMELKSYDNKCVRILTSTGEVYEGIVSYCGHEYVFHEYGCDQEALYLTPILFYEDDIESVISLEAVDGPFGHYSEKYGLLEKKCLEWGSDMIEEILASEDDTQILRMLACMKDHLQSLAARAVPGMAPWRSGNSMLDSEEDENEPGPVYRGELESMLDTLVKHSGNEEVIREAENLLERLTAAVL